MNWDHETDLYIALTPCKKHITNENPQYSSGHHSMFCGLTGRKHKEEGIRVHV